LRHTPPLCLDHVQSALNRGIFLQGFANEIFEKPVFETDG
jgi:hypothetical protein